MATRKVDDRIRAAYGIRPKRETLAQLRARVDAEEEVKDLMASDIACAVADAYANGDILVAPGSLCIALDRLEAVTRPSAMRKVRP